MKKRNIYLAIFTLIVISLSTFSMVNGQPPMPPGSHGSNGNQGAGGAAPVDGGVVMLVLSGVGYGGYKLVRKVRGK
jgi:hypothetical protein